MRHIILLVLISATAALATTVAKCCPANEQYSKCGANGCQNTCAKPELAKVCKAVCTPGCICVPGYLRDNNGKCVKACDCPKPTKTTTTAKPTKKTTCTTKPTKKTTCTTKPTKPSCPVNEVYSDCDANICQNTCVSPQNRLMCKAGCKAGCVCKDNMLRNSKGKCVKPVDCDNCGKNEVFSECGNHACINTCANPTFAQVSKCACNPGCICKDGLLRNNNNECVTPDECGCGGDPNAVLTDCGDICPINCGNKDNPPLCPAVCGDAKCRCKPGYIYGWNGLCVKPEECPTCSGQNEFYNCGSACDTTCATLGEVCPIVNIKCNEMCYCMDGFARNAENICVPISECPVRDCPSDPNALFVSYPNPCPTTCETIDNPITVCGRMSLQYGCECKKGYVVGPNGNCILPSECPVPECPANEEYSKCGNNACQNTCSMPDVSTFCKPSCNPGCICKEGMVRNDDGICVLIEECPPRECPTDPNAIIVPCGDPCPTTCENKDDGGIRPCPAICIVNGCKCKDGYVLGKDGICSLARNCPVVPKLVCKKNEVYVACPSPCPPEVTCDSYFDGRFPLCPIILNSPNCKPACRCKEGYIRNSKGACIRPQKCCTAPNTVLVASPNVCPGGTCASPDRAECELRTPDFGCQCIEGYVKISDEDPTCIPLCECCDYDDYDYYK